MLRILRSSLTIPADRQRGTITPEDVAEKRDSIMKVGLLHPPVVEVAGDGYILRAGETRLQAIDLIAVEGDVFRCGDELFSPGELPVTPMSDLDPILAFEIELEENVRRKPLDWKREADAFARLAAMKAKASPNLSSRDVIRETIASVGKVAATEVKSLAEGHQTILLGNSLDIPEVAAARTKKDALKALSRVLQKGEDKAAAAVAPSDPNIINGDCITVMQGLPSASLDGICTDPPYGIGITQMSYQKASEQEYDDSYDSWCELMAALWPELARVLKPDSAGYMFCDFSNFETLRKEAERHGFECFPRPFIWDRSPDGRLTTPEKWPRRVYECILFFRRGNRPLYEIRSDVLRYPADRDPANYHGAKKPVELYIDLLERICRPGDRVADFFAGSGPMLRAARKLSLNALVVEKDESYLQLMLRLANEEPK